MYAGLVTGLTAAYLVFGTARIEARAQRTLRADFTALAQVVAEEPPASGARSDATPSPTTEAPEGLVPAGAQPAAAVGSPVARLRIPALGLDRIVVEGVDTAELRRGPGHYPGTPQPGEQGNVGIAGHRTTYGAPFGNLDRLQPLDRITLDTVDGRSFTYEVIGTEIVAPTEVRVLADHGDDRLTLTSCHPRRSARRRIVVSARRVAEDGEAVTPSPAKTPSPAVTPSPTSDPGRAAPASVGGSELAGSSSPASSSLPWWGWLALGAVAVEARHQCRRRLAPRGRRWSAAAALIPTLVVLVTTWRGVVVGADLIQWNL